MIYNNGAFYPFASSVAEAKNQSTVNGALRPGMIVQVMNAVTAGKLSTYQFLLGDTAESIPAIFQPNDNPGNYYYQLVS